MGQECCYSGKMDDQHGDLRQGKRSIKKTEKQLDQSRLDKSQNPFQRQLENPEFKVTRRDSLGTAAKEHTNLIISQGGTSSNISPQSSTAVSNKTEQEQSDNQMADSVRTEHTNKAEVEVNIISAESSPEALQRDISLQLSQKDMSFGQQNRFTLGISSDNKGVQNQMDTAYDSGMGNERHISILSIKDLMEVTSNDHLPASPATQSNNVKETYFQ